MRARFAFGILLAGLAVASVGCQAVGNGTGLPMTHNLPPAHQVMHPGPGVDGPGPGVMPPIAAMGAPPQSAPEAQVWFAKPDGMQIRWDVSGVSRFDSEPMVVPGRQNFPQGGIFRLKLSNIPGRFGVELYPTMELGPTTPRTGAYLAHNAVPIQFTEEDFDQVLSGNFVTKVIYLPDPEFQELALAGVETLVSTRLDPGVDPIVEADRRGAILAIVRMGNKDEEMPGAGGAAEPIAPAAYYHAAMAARGPMGMPHPPYSTGSVMPNYISGVSGPQWGMPMSGTPIGLPGPPHVPHGGPAGLQEHTMYNHTHMYMPSPVRDMRFHVQQTPGFSYPAPANRVYVRDRTLMPQHVYLQPPSDMLHVRRSSNPYAQPHAQDCQCEHCLGRGGR